MAAASSRKFSFLSISLLISLLLLIHAPRSCSLSFSFNFSDSAGNPCDAELRCEHDARMGPGVLELTKNEIRGDSFSVGRASYARPVALWNNSTGELASFTSNFTFQIKPLNETTYYRCNGSNGDGMAFFLAHYPSKIPPNSYGENLALFNDSNNSNATGDNRVVAVEFDTFFNGLWDKTPNHVGIDVNSIDSKAFVNVTKDLVSEDAIMTAKISYNNLTGILAADLQIDEGDPYTVSYPVDMKGSLPEEVAVGFSAATGFCIELHQVMSWSFSSTLGQGATGGRRRWQRLLSVLVPTVVVAFLALLVCAAVGFVVRQRRISKKLQQGDSDDDGGHEQAEFESWVGPRRYRYHQLAAATSNFAEEEKLGRGGSGNVYRGSLGDHDRAVAIKKFSATESSVQGRKEFEAEVKIISRLRHRNLVQLLGWCDSGKGLLLVYELVPEGSLDRHLYNHNSLLSWPERYVIIVGLGSALRYLHTECDQCVLHGDIKPSNILLDSSRSTKLGDFGLARLVDHEAGPRRTQVVMGTAGYIDPEFIRSRRRSVKSDVYSFGVVLLEIVTGRRPKMEDLDKDKLIPLLKWIWDLYDRNTLLEAVDRRLVTEGKLLVDVGCEWQLQRVLVVGLWCAHPESGVRPSIVQAMNVLQSEDVTLPVLSRTTYFSCGARGNHSPGSVNISGDYDSPGTVNVTGDYDSPTTGNISGDDVSFDLNEHYYRKGRNKR